MQSIELLLDPVTDRAVRAQRVLLADAGLPSQARHTGATNAPHVTLLAASTLSDAHDANLGAAMGALPVPVVFAGLVVFGRPPRGLVLCRGVVVTDVILRLHRAVFDVVSPADDALAPHSRPGSWTPHVTLASRLTPVELAAAVDLLSSSQAPERGDFASGRRWDGTAGVAVPLGGPPGEPEVRSAESRPAPQPVASASSTVGGAETRVRSSRSASSSRTRAAESNPSS